MATSHFTPLQAANRRLQGLITERKSNGWDTEYRDLAENIVPWKSRFITSDRNRGNKRSTKILNPVGRESSRILAAGLTAGMTNPSRPWINLEAFDPDLMDYAPVKEWLERYERVMMMVMQRSNFYQVMQNVYNEEGVFGTGCFSIMDDYEDVMLARSFTAGEYAIKTNDRGRCSAFAREYETTVENLIGDFGIENVQPRTREKYDKGDYDCAVTCFHLIEINHDDGLDLGMSKGRPFRNIYWEQGALDKKEADESFLSANGMHEMAIMAPRWDTNSGDDYGNGPGQDTLPDLKQIQTMEKRKLNKLEKHNNPSMKGPATMRNDRSSTLPGDMTYVPDNSNAKYEPSYVIDGNVDSLRQEIATKEDSVRRAFYVDLFLRVIQDERNQRATAREIAEIHEEKLLMIGPALYRNNYEGLDPAIHRITRMIERASSNGKLLPPPPPEMNGMPITVKYVSLLAQAQRLVDSQSITNLAQFVTTLAPANTEILDKFDFDMAVDKYGEVIGAPTQLIRSEVQVTKIRNQRAEAQQQQLALQQGSQAIDAAKQLSETSTTGGNALGDILGI